MNNSSNQCCCDNYTRLECPVHGVTADPENPANQCIPPGARYKLNGYCAACKREWIVTCQTGTEVTVRSFHCACGHVTDMDGRGAVETEGRMERLQQERLTWAMACPCSCPACEKLHDLIRDEYDDPKNGAPETGALPVTAEMFKSRLFQQFLSQDFWHAHHVDLIWRYNGQDVREEADWLKDIWYALRGKRFAPETPAPRFPRAWGCHKENGWTIDVGYIERLRTWIKEQPDHFGASDEAIEEVLLAIEAIDRGSPLDANGFPVKANCSGENGNG